MNPENLEKRGEVEKNRETSVEKHEDENIIHGAEMLEEPQDGSFTSGLQMFIAWVKSLVAPNDKT